MFITNVYKPPVLTAPDNVTIRKQKNTTLSYNIRHLDTLFEDLSYNIGIVGSYYGTFDSSLVNYTPKESSLDITFNLSTIDKTSVDLSINIIDESGDTISQIEHVILNTVYQLIVDEDSLIVEYDQV